MLSFSLPLDEYNDNDPERYQVRINGVPETVLVDSTTVTIDPDGRKDVRAILSDSIGDGLTTFVCSDSVSGAEYTVEIEPEPTPEEKVELLNEARKTLQTMAPGFPYYFKRGRYIVTMLPIEPRIYLGS